MIPKQFRLKNKRAFDATYKQRTVVSDKFLILYTGKKKQNENTQTKIGFVVSKKYHKRAVKRNRIKRLMREAVRLIIKENKLESDYMSLIFLPKNTALDTEFKTVKDSVESLLKRSRQAR